MYGGVPPVTFATKLKFSYGSTPVKLADVTFSVLAGGAIPTGSASRLARNTSNLISPVTALIDPNLISVMAVCAAVVINSEAPDVPVAVVWPRLNPA